MTQKKAIEIVVANVKMGWMPKRWASVNVSPIQIEFKGFVPALLEEGVPLKWHGEWLIPRKWLEEKGYL